jgi:hypothetical protein
MLLDQLRLGFSLLIAQAIDRILDAQPLKDLLIQMFVGPIREGAVFLLPFFLCNVFGSVQAYFFPKMHFTLVSLNTQVN